MPENAPHHAPEGLNGRARVSNPDTAAIPEIPYEEFVDAQRDPQVKRFLQEANAERDEIRREGPSKS